LLDLEVIEILGTTRITPGAELKKPKMKEKIESARK
jgi:hypothetical protein